MLLVAAIAILVTMALALIAIMAFAMGRTDFLDLALVYALINFIAVLAVLWFVQENQLREQRRAEANAKRPATGSGGE